MIFLVNLILLVFLGSCSSEIGNAKISYDDAYIHADIYADSSSAAVIYTNQPSSFAANTRKWQGCPTICKDIEGNLYSAWYSGGVYEAPGNYITLSLSDDGGISWKSNKLIINPISPNYRHIDPILWNDSVGKLHLSWTMSDGMWDGAEGGVWDIELMQVSNKILFTKPQKLFHGIMNTKPTITSTQKILFPVFGWNFTYENSKNKWGIFPIKPTPPEYNGAFLYSSDISHDGKFSRPVRLSKLLIPQNKRWADEHMFIELSKDNIFCISRSFDGMMYANSYDGGNTWTNSKIFDLLGPTPESKGYIGRLKSGNLVLILNNSKSRTNLTLFLSEDGGKTWPFKVLLDDRKDVAYPDLIQTEDDKIHIIYDRERAKEKEIIQIVLTESEIKSGFTLFEKTLISK